MSVTSQQLQEWLNAKECEHLEFKEAKNNFHFEKLVKYCAALANEGGGSIVRAGTAEPAVDEALSTFAGTGTEDTRAPGTPQPDPSAAATNVAGKEAPARREAFQRQAAAQANGKP